METQKHGIIELSLWVGVFKLFWFVNCNLNNFIMFHCLKYYSAKGCGSSLLKKQHQLSVLHF